MQKNTQGLAVANDEASDIEDAASANKLFTEGFLLAKGDQLHIRRFFTGPREEASTPAPFLPKSWIVGLPRVYQDVYFLIVLLAKNEETTELKNWRPISPINSDYKLIMALLSGRLIGEEQVGFLGGRSIFDPILAVKAALIQHQPVSMTGFLLLIDLEKAYDRVNQTFLFRVLEKFGLPPSWMELYRCYMQRPHQRY